MEIWKDIQKYEGKYKINNNHAFNKRLIKSSVRIKALS